MSDRHKSFTIDSSSGSLTLGLDCGSFLVYFLVNCLKMVILDSSSGFIALFLASILLLILDFKSAFSLSFFSFNF